MERTLLTTGLTAAGMESLYRKQERYETPHLDISYQPTKESISGEAKVMHSPYRHNYYHLSLPLARTAHRRPVSGRLSRDGGSGIRPDMKVVSLYVDQKPRWRSERRARAEFGFTVYPTIAETLRCGATSLPWTRC